MEDTYAAMTCVRRALSCRHSRWVARWDEGRTNMWPVCLMYLNHQTQIQARVSLLYCVCSVV